jgi:ribosome-binding factor A
LTPCLGPDDGLDPRRLHDRRTAPTDGGRKDQQLCRQAQHALSATLAGLGDDALHNLTVIAVVPAPHAGRLLVTVAADDPDHARERLAAAAGRLRTAVAEAVRRRKVPELAFAVV